MPLRRFSDHRSEPLEQQPKNGLALAFGPAQPLRVVVEDGARSAAFETTSGPVIEFMGGNFDRQQHQQTFLDAAFDLVMYGNAGAIDSLYYCAHGVFEVERWQR